MSTLNNKNKQHLELLDDLLSKLEPIDFHQEVYPYLYEDVAIEVENQKMMKELKLEERHYLIVCIEKVCQLAKENDMGLCQNNFVTYIYNGSYWLILEDKQLEFFLGKAAGQLGIDKYESKYYQFKEKLVKQFYASAYISDRIFDKNRVLVNLQNGTFEVTAKKQDLRPFNSNDFLTYQLSFEYNPTATAPIFEEYLNRVLPDKSCQNVLAEYLGSIFIRNGNDILKLEKALLLYGTGANGKSVFFEVVNALLGDDNICNYSLQDLCNPNGYYRTRIANKLINYASEISDKVDTTILKQLISGEPVSARALYKDPINITDYAKLIFNCNSLPVSVEHNNAFFRRLIIIPFDVTIPEEEQDKSLHIKIIQNELSGVFNWVIEGLKRLLLNKNFTSCAIIDDAIQRYKIDSNSIKSFLVENEFEPSYRGNKINLNILYDQYLVYCSDSRMRPFGKKNFSKLLESEGFEKVKANGGATAFSIQKIESPE